MTWTAVASLPEAMNGPAVAAAGGKLYAFGSDTTEEHGWVYDPALDSWSATADLTSPAYSSPFAVEIGGLIYLINVASTNGVRVYDPATDSWDVAGAQPPGDHRGCGACSDGEKIYFLEYPDETAYLTTRLPQVSVWDPGTGWSTTGTTCPSGVAADGLQWGVAFVADGVIYYFNGWPGATPDGLVVSYTIATDTWAAVTSVPRPRESYGSGASMPAGALLPLVGGDDATAVRDYVDTYDPASDTWGTYDALPTAIDEPGLGVCGDYLYVVGGYIDPTGATTQVLRAPLADFTSGTDVAIDGTSSRSRDATATISFDLFGTSTHSRGAAATLDAPIDFTALTGVGWERNGRRRHAHATIDVDTIVIDPPSGHHMIATAWLDISGPPDFDAHKQPDASSWPSTEHHSTWGRYRIRISGHDVTHFRGAMTLVAQESDTEPFGDDTAQLVFPMIGPFEALGVGDLDWLHDDVPVVIEKVTAGGTRHVRFEGDITGFVDSYDGHTAPLVAQCTGIVKTLDERITKPRMDSDPIDCGKFLHDLIAYENDYGWQGHGLPIVDTGIQTAERGGYGDPLLTVTIQDLLATMQTGEPNQWTIVNDRPRGLRLVLKDRDTVHFTIWCGQPGVTHQLTRDPARTYDAIFGEGQDDGTQIWRNTQYPNAPVSAPVFPLAAGSVYNAGDGHGGFDPFADELSSRGYPMASGGTYLGGDVDTVRDFQDDAGILVDGVVGPQTWNAAFQTGFDANILDAYIRPLAVLRSAEPYLYNARGGIIGDNPDYTGRKRREKLEQFGTLSKHDGKRSAKRELPIIADSDWAGTVTLTNIDPPEMAALDIRSGMNFRFMGHRGTNRLLHIAKADRNPGMRPGEDRTVTLTTSERADDYVTLAARMQRRRDVVDQSGRTRAPRRTSKQSPDFAPWDSESGAGFLKPVAQFGGLWNVYVIPAGERGSITHVRLITSTPTLIAAAVFNWKVTANHLASLPGLDDPSAGALDGSDPWQGNADALTVRPTYADQPWLAWATGGPGAMQGYWPNVPAPDATITGVLDDAQQWSFHSKHAPWLWLAVWTRDSCTISGDPQYKHRALFPGADA